MANDKKTSTPPGETTGGPDSARSWRREILFLVVFLGLLAGSFTLISWNPVNDHVIVPFTAGVAKVSGATLVLLGEDVTMRGTIIESPDFAVNIKNGCNGVETMLIFLSAVLAFPSPWNARAIGLVFGILAIQVINLVRVVALFYTGAYFPTLFDASHTVIWQSVVILCGVLLWIMWADRVARPRPAAAAG
ncbi:MAG TPA: exosortase H [Thermoanaerobaculia bacterium]|nr:exosortase H [Thermoanaerobaculia bacterium]